MSNPSEKSGNTVAIWLVQELTDRHNVAAKDIWKQLHHVIDVCEVRLESQKNIADDKQVRPRIPKKPPDSQWHTKMTVKSWQSSRQVQELKQQAQRDEQQATTQ